MKFFYQGALLFTLLWGWGGAIWLFGVCFFVFVFSFNFWNIWDLKERCGTLDSKHKIKMTKLVLVSHNLLKCSESLKAMSLPTASTSCSPADTFPKKRLSYMLILKGKLSCMPLSSGGSWAADPQGFCTTPCWPTGHFGSRALSLQFALAFWT